MTSALTGTGASETASQASTNGWLKANAGSLAIAVAIVLAAGVYGFVSSPAFAIFFMGFVLFLVLFGLAVWIGISPNVGFIGGVIALGFFIASLGVLFGAINEAKEKISQSEAAQVTAAASASEQP